MVNKNTKESEQEKKIVELNYLVSILICMENVKFNQKYIYLYLKTVYYDVDMS